jgi:hypothetical protein
MLNQFFDRAMYYSIQGYEESARRDEAQDAD